MAIFAYRLEKAEGWFFARTSKDQAGLTASMAARGLPVADIRLLLNGAGRPDHEGDDLGIDPVAALGLDMLLGRGWTWDEAAAVWRSPEENLLSFPGEPVEVAAVEVAFGAAEFGWQPVTLIAALAKAEFDASHVYDPFPDILIWLEKVATGAIGRVVVDQEGSHFEMLCLPAGEVGKARIVAANLRWPEEVFRQVIFDILIDRLIFSRSFYGALRAHSESALYDPSHWSRLSLKEDLARRRVSYDPEHWAVLNARELNTVLWKLYPIYDYGPSTAKDRKEVYDALTEDAIASLPKVDAEEREGVPYLQFLTPKEFDSWPLPRRRIYIQELLEEELADWNAEDLWLLRSPLLERLSGRTAD